MLLCVGLLCDATPLAAGDHDQQLEQLRVHIQRLQTDLNDTRGRRNLVRDEVRDLERRIHEVLRLQRRLDARLLGYRRERARLRAQVNSEQRVLAVQKLALERQIQAAYAMGREEPVKLLLNLDDPVRAARMLTYYRLFNEARAERITAIQTSVGRLQTLEHQVRTQTTALEVARAEQERARQEFETTRARRTELLANLNREVHSRSDELERLRTDEKRLERLVREIAPRLPELAPPEPGARFASLKGRLPLPLAGHIVARFGADKGIGSLKWRGSFIAAREGQEVHAVHRGRVVYADWLRGFGLLLILEHGDGYMTLYGHNQSLYREVGEWVDAGGIIAAAGNTGDAPQPGVYFEIRHHGEPEDTQRWCSTAAIKAKPERRAKPNR